MGDNVVVIGYFWVWL